MGGGPTPTAIALWPDQRRFAWRALAVGVVGAAGIVVSFALPGAGAPVSIGVSFVGALTALGVLVLGLRRRRVYVGSDGLVVGRAGRFVSMASIVRLERQQTPYARVHHLAWLVLEGGERILLGGGHGFFGHAALDRLDGAYEALERAIDAYRARVPAERAEQFGRADRPAGDWLAELRALREREGFRQGALPRDELVRVIEDPTAAPSARAGAAYVLRGLSPTEAERTRVRVVAGETASRKLRVVLEESLDAEDDEVVAGSVARIERAR